MLLQHKLNQLFRDWSTSSARDRWFSRWSLSQNYLRPRAREGVRGAREVALSLVFRGYFIFSLFITCNFDGVFCSVKAILSFHFASAENITYMLTRSKISHAISILISFNISIAMYRSCSLFSEGYCYHILILSCPTR